MNYVVKMQKQPLTNIENVILILDFRAGEETRDANALEAVLTRYVGVTAKDNNGPDQRAFGHQRGEGAGEVRPVDTTIEIVDPHSRKTIHKFAGKGFVKKYSINDRGQRIVETVRLRMNKVVYSGSSGKKSPVLDVLKRK